MHNENEGYIMRMYPLIYLLLCFVNQYNCQHNLNMYNGDISFDSNEPLSNVKDRFLDDTNRKHKDINTNYNISQNSVDQHAHIVHYIHGNSGKHSKNLKSNKKHKTKARRAFEAKEFNEQNCEGNRSVIVHLFNWKWTDIAKECLQFLGPKGFCGVQVSPPNEHKLEYSGKIKRPWWERYQPISYKLGSRSGTPKEFASMVKTCNRVNVRVYVDIVINHMMAPDGTSGRGSWGSNYNSPKLDFPAVPYNSTDFHCCFCKACSSLHCGIDTYRNVQQVRNCRLLGLADLDLRKPVVREKISTYLNHLLHLGVAGFRVDAAKHMWPADLKAIFNSLIPLKKKYFPTKMHPFIYNEVIDSGNEGIHGAEYYSAGLGRVTEFKFSDRVAKAFRGEFSLSHLKSFGESWQMYPSQYALVFVDNHDNQRGHGSGDNSILTFYEPRLYKMATAFALAWPYGAVRIMSSYRWGWNKLKNTDLGPPTNDGEDIKSVKIKADGSCDDGGPHTWICEHRWRQITNMVKWRNIAGGQEWNINHWWDNGGNHIAFSRGGTAFIAFNNDNHLPMSVSLLTGLLSGKYCDVISGDISRNRRTCSGKQFLVDSMSRIKLTIMPKDEDPVIAINIDSKIQEYSETLNQKPTDVNTDGHTLRTVIFIQYNTKPDTHVFIRGGISHKRRKGCSKKNSGRNHCAINITHNPLRHRIRKLTKWQKNDKYLDWYGAEDGQVDQLKHSAGGSPLSWTTNDVTHSNYHPLNKYGKAYWILDVNMNSSQTENGWFEFKLYTKSLSRNSEWEGDIKQKECIISNGKLKYVDPVPYKSKNHMAKCGHINVFKVNSGDCHIFEF